MIPPSSASPGRGVIQNRSYLAFDAAAEETIYTPAFRVPTSYSGSGTLKLAIGYYCANAGDGDVAWTCAVEATPDAAAQDLDAAGYFDTVNTTGGTVTAPATQGHLDVATLTLTNKDSMAAGDMIRLAIARDADAGGDTQTGDAHLLYATLYEEV